MYTNILKLNYIYCTTFPTICYHIFHSHTKNFLYLSNINKKSPKLHHPTPPVARKASKINAYQHHSNHIPKNTLTFKLILYQIF